MATSIRGTIYLVIMNKKRDIHNENSPQCFYDDKGENIYGSSSYLQICMNGMNNYY